MSKSNFEFNTGKNTNNTAVEAAGLFGATKAFLKRHKTKFIVGASLVVIAGVAYYVYTNKKGDTIQIPVGEQDQDTSNSNTDS